MERYKPDTIVAGGPPVVELKLSDFGLETVADAASRKGWSAKTLQNWVGKGKIPVLVVGTGRGTRLVRIADVDELSPPGPRGRPPKQNKPVKKRGRK